jgi:hypothetical protein
MTDGKIRGGAMLPPSYPNTCDLWQQRQNINKKHKKPTMVLPTTWAADSEYFLEQNDMDL